MTTESVLIVSLGIISRNGKGLILICGSFWNVGDGEFFKAFSFLMVS